MQYQYGTILRATCDDPNPENTIEEGDIVIEPGKIPDGDSYHVFADDDIGTVTLETVEVYELPEPMGKRGAVECARDQYVDEEQEADA